MLVYSTYLGGSGYDFANALAVDGFGAAYVGGQTGSWDLPTVNPNQAALAGGVDGFVLQLSPDGSALQFATYLGGVANDAINGVALDGLGNVYVSGQTASNNFPEQGGLVPPPWVRWRHSRPAIKPASQSHPGLD